MKNQNENNLICPLHEYECLLCAKMLSKSHICGEKALCYTRRSVRGVASVGLQGSRVPHAIECPFCLRRINVLTLWSFRLWRWLLSCFVPCLLCSIQSLKLLPCALIRRYRITELGVLSEQRIRSKCGHCKKTKNLYLVAKILGLWCILRMFLLFVEAAFYKRKMLLKDFLCCDVMKCIIDF